ncbi:MAG: DUF4810 domain-containing protein [Treponema sp.]|nr:DUF4810 domain-containing protein [Treponema sp.]
MKIKTAIVTIPVLAACLAGCASQQLYYWGSYQDQVYSYLSGESLPAQIQALEKDKEKITSSGKAAPPGFYAQLGLLYAETGDRANAIACFETEKAHFPEAAPYMDYLLKRYKQ